MSHPSVSHRQIAAARVLLGLSQEAIAAAAGCADVIVARTEAGETDDGIEALRLALEAAGISFIDGAEPGVQIRSSASEGLRADQLNASNDD